MKMVQLKWLLIAMFLYIIGCRDSSYEGSDLGRKYCDCMEKNQAGIDYYNARIICDSKFALENRFFRVNYIESVYGNGYMRTLDSKTRDSVNEFTHSFTAYIFEHCPYVYRADSIRENYLKKIKKK
jgi:hypothetical protein